ncbi:hypothetical protein PCANC_16060 [Puccinia coronata f. sp. avenae]|uniref:Uncharacterized protein n=1 Tax=Puccinia coronata f. sp. avenae TaxID=200324 RepID=A0A2N5UA65_9BASI|nr:hypothetical protein PCANC_16060 [Puccinia coronata f. sp. avenae]
MPYLDPHRFHFLLIDQVSGLRPILLYADFVKIRPDNTIKVELDMTTSDMTELKQAVFEPWLQVEGH